MATKKEKDPSKIPLSDITIQRVSPSSRTILASWKWTKSGTTGYHVRWFYVIDTLQKKVLGSEVDIPYQPRISGGSNCQYEMPENADYIIFRIQPYTDNKKKDSKGKDTKTPAWTKDWSQEKTFYQTYRQPVKPPTPSVTLLEDPLQPDTQPIQASVSNLDPLDIEDGKSTIEFEWYINDLYALSESALIVSNSATIVHNFPNGNKYKARCRLFRNGTGNKEKYISPYSEFSSNVALRPTDTITIQRIEAKSATSAYLSWSKGGSEYYGTTASSWDIEYTDDPSKFDITGDTQTITGITTLEYIVTGLEAGHVYYFRVRAVNSNGHSNWGPYKDVTLGEIPGAPTTWSNLTKVTRGQTIKFYWNNNARDASAETEAKITAKFYNNSGQLVDTQVWTVVNTRDDDHKYDTSTYTYTVPTGSTYSSIDWCVKCKGVLNEYGPDSTVRTIEIYDKGFVTLGLYYPSGSQISSNVIQHFPFQLRCSTTPSSVTPMQFYVVCKAREQYDTYDRYGEPKIVMAGDILYSNLVSPNQSYNQLYLDFSAIDIDLEDYMYSFEVYASTTNGVNTQVATLNFSVNTPSSDFGVDADVFIDENYLTAQINPYCTCVIENTSTEETETVRDDVQTEACLFDVYRVDYDGGYTEIASGITGDNVVVDPHPTLNGVRYRIIATDTSTGEEVHGDTAMYEVDTFSAVIQWDERSITKNLDEMVTYDQMTHGNVLRLPYNFDISENSAPEVELVKYAGRKNPVTYYGTVRNFKCTWNADIPADDSLTLSMLRKLQNWMGDAYVREPSGLGYWATVNVNISRTHMQVTVPVSITITRVEGGA